MALITRIPGPGDAAALADLHVATWRETYTHLLPPDFFSNDHVEGRHRMWTQVLARPRGDVLVRVAEADRRLIGFAWAGRLPDAEVEVAPDVRQLFALYVSAAHHGAGVGQMLLDEVLEGRPSVLWVAKENPRAVAFYLRNGFRFDGTEQIDPHAPSITDARMVR